MRRVLILVVLPMSLRGIFRVAEPDQKASIGLFFVLVSVVWGPVRAAAAAVLLCRA